MAQLAKCSDWIRGSRDERLATIGAVRAHINLQDTAVKTPVLSNRAAYRVFANTCKRPFARSFRLYKLYARAASFAPFAD